MARVSLAQNNHQYRQSRERLGRIYPKNDPAISNINSRMIHTPDRSFLRLCLGDFLCRPIILLLIDQKVIEYTAISKETTPK